MAVKRTTLHTGIYHTKINRVEIRLDEEGCTDLKELLAGGKQDDPLGLSTMESKTTDYIKEYVENELGKLYKPLRRESIEWVVQEYVNNQREVLATQLESHLSQEKR